MHKPSTEDLMIGIPRAVENVANIQGKTAEKPFVDKGYRGHGLKEDFTQVFLSGQKRGVTASIKRDLRRRSVIEPIIGHLKNDSLLRRNYLKGHKGDKIKALLSSIGFNFRQIPSFLAV